MKGITMINGYIIVAYKPETCKKYRIPYPTYAAFCCDAIQHLNPSYEECSFDNLDELVEWCRNN